MDQDYGSGERHRAYCGVAFTRGMRWTRSCSTASGLGGREVWGCWIDQSMWPGLAVAGLLIMWVIDAQAVV